MSYDLCATVVSLHERVPNAAGRDASLWRRQMSVMQPKQATASRPLLHGVALNKGGARPQPSVDIGISTVATISTLLLRPQYRGTNTLWRHHTILFWN